MVVSVVLGLKNLEKKVAVGSKLVLIEPENSSGDYFALWRVKSVEEGIISADYGHRIKPKSVCGFSPLSGEPLPVDMVSGIFVDKYAISQVKDSKHPLHSVARVLDYRFGNGWEKIG